jgi:ubiquinone/menaquinone biosynthesis C-methylase UbiE
MRAHLGCGDKYWPGWVNVDGFTDCDIKSGVDVLPFKDGELSEIQAIHVFEHIDRMKADAVLKEWFRCLGSGGRLVLELPCLDKIAQMIVAGEKNMVMTLFGLYGDVRQSRKEMLHPWCWSKTELTEAITACGFKNVSVEEPVFHYSARDMRITATKEK